MVGGRGRVVWLHGSKGVHEMRGGRVVSGCMGQRDCMR